MFPEIAAAFPDYDFAMFDYCEVTQDGDTILRPIPEQAKILQSQIDAVESDDVTLLCHSLGSVVAGLVDLSRVDRVILPAPPVKMHIRTEQWLRDRPGSHFQDDGTFVLPRSDGTTSYLPPEYIASFGSDKPMELYQKIANKKPTVIIRAIKDEVIGLTNVNEIDRVQHIDIDTDHNFTGTGRPLLIATLRTVL